MLTDMGPATFGVPGVFFPAPRYAAFGIFERMYGASEGVRRPR